MLFEPLIPPTIHLASRTALAPMTGSRAVDANTPDALMIALDMATLCTPGRKGDTDHPALAR
jgi:2,4-dienoyl-CoA reductase-like NADH-dependent reductase (Old Yellow Enzyme family)